MVLGAIWWRVCYQQGLIFHVFKERGEDWAHLSEHPERKLYFEIIRICSFHHALRVGVFMIFDIPYV